MLNLLEVDLEALRAALSDDETFDDFDPEDSWSFDSILLSLTTLLGERISTTNPALAGPYVNVTADSSENIACILCADPEGIIEGYVWTYDLYGQRSLSLGTRFYEYKHIRPKESGYDGLLEMASDVLNVVNEAINNFNRFVKGA